MNRTNCTACGHEIRYRDEHAGRRVRCSACSTVVRLPDESSLDLQSLGEGSTIVPDHSPGPPTAPAAPIANPVPVAPRPRRPLLRPRAEWTAWDALLFKTGVGVILFGVAAIILPMFGLQFRKLSKLGEPGSISAGWGLIGTGAFLIAYVVALRGRMVRLVLAAIAAGFLGFAILVAIGALSSGSRSTPPPAWPPARGPVANGDPSRPPDFGPNRPAGQRPPGAAFTPPQTPQSAASTDEIVAELAKRFGEAKVVQVTLEDVSNMELSRHLSAIGSRALTDSASSSYRTRSVDGAQLLIIAPIDDIDAFVARLDLGTPTGIDRVARKLTIKVDRSRLKSTARGKP